MQLTILGYILVPIFDLNAWWLNILYMLFMLGVAAAEAISQTTRCLQRVWDTPSSGSTQ